MLFPPFCINGNYRVYGFENTTDEQIDLIQSDMPRIFSEITPCGKRIYALDLHHSAFLYDPLNGDKQTDVKVYGDQYQNGFYTAYFPSFYPDGDYHFFIEEDFLFGWLGHPWRNEIWVFGDTLIEKTEKLYEKFGFIKIL